MATKTQICNLALSHLQVGSGISNFDTDESEAGMACRDFYQITLEEVLAAFNWPFATKKAVLDLIEEDPLEDLGNEWKYAYRYPAECARFIRIVDGNISGGRKREIRYEVADHGDEQVIFTNEPDAIGEYVRKITDTNRFSSPFIQTFSRLLAANLAPRLSAEPAKYGPVNLAAYQMQLDQAEANAENENNKSDPYNGDLAAARNAD